MISFFIESSNALIKQIQWSFCIKESFQHPLMIKEIGKVLIDSCLLYFPMEVIVEEGKICLHHIKQQIEISFKNLHNKANVRCDYIFDKMT